MTEALRELVRDRARGRCEYCLYPETETLISHQIDHVIARQHGGTDDAANLALCCAVCNRSKGPNLSSIDPETNEVTELFHPRRGRWEDHFALRNGRIVGLSAAGRATVFLLRLNDEERLTERRSLMARGFYG